MLVDFISLKLKNFKNHQDLTVNFGEMTEITGDNGKGKSSIGEAVTWLLYSNDTLGSKMDPIPITYKADETLVQLLLEVDGKSVLLGRGQKKGKAEFYINEVPSKATEFNDLVSQLFDKDLFFSLFNPDYFFTLKWDKQRSMLLQYVTTPANKEVLKHLPELQANKLGTLLKKHSLDDIEKIHKDNKNKKDIEYIAAQSRTKTLQGQLEQLGEVNVPAESLKVEIAQFDKQIKEINSVIDSASEKNGNYNSTQLKINSLQEQIEMSKLKWPSLKNEVIEDTCRTCKRPLDDNSVEAVKADKESRIEQYKSNHSDLIKRRDEVNTRLQEMEYVDVSEQIEKVRKLTDQRQELLIAYSSISTFGKLQDDIEVAKQAETDILTSLNDSIFVLDSVKAFRAKEAELQAEKVQALFTTLSIRLFKQNKGDGEFKPDFEVQMDGKDYSKLSLSEGIRAGLELREVLSKQSGVIVPCFIDNAESITSFKKPTGQLITSRVVAGKELTIERVDN
jgi:energy-coupling factor transporter ATP-binding protein EcfA2